MEQALRYNDSKSQLSLLDLDSFSDVADVLQFGANKYSRDNWRKGLPVTSILDSLLRHVAALQRGEFLDPESGLPHTGHIGCNVMFLNYVMRNKPEFIDIPGIIDSRNEYYESN